MEAAQGAYQAAQSQLVVAKAKLSHDQALYDYSKITAPFDGVVTQRYANLGALMQAGTTSTQATPLVRLSDENLYRLVIPVPESDVKYIHVGDPVEVRVPRVEQDGSGQSGAFLRRRERQRPEPCTPRWIFPTPDGQLVPGTLRGSRYHSEPNNGALVVPLQAIDHQGDTDVRLWSWIRTTASRAAGHARHPDAGLRGNRQRVAAGEQVVVSDRSGLKAGQTVKPKPLQSVSYEGSAATVE